MKAYLIPVDSLVESEDAFIYDADVQIFPVKAIARFDCPHDEDGRLFVFCRMGIVEEEACDEAVPDNGGGVAELQCE